MREFFSDMLSTLVFVGIYWTTGSIYAAVAIAIVIGGAQIAYFRFKHTNIDLMQWLGLGLVVVFGGVTLITQDSRFIMVKPTLIHFAIAAVMLRRGWMGRYLPPILTENVPEAVIIRAGHAWLALMVGLGIANLIVALAFGERIWIWYVSFGAVGAKLALLAFQYGYFRMLVRGAVRAARLSAPAAQPYATDARSIGGPS